MQVLYTILYILLFIVCLSVLIIVHELGHLAMAKAFKVYCFEYSIGFGPKIFSVKRKNGETKVSLRAIPFGGYVSMYGEGVEVPDGLEIPPERSIENIKKWKKAIILVAGVTMNALLALTIFFISNACFPVSNYYLNQITVSETNTLTDKSFVTGDYMEYSSIVGSDGDNIAYYVLDENATLYFKDSTSESGISVLLSPAISNVNQLDWSYFIKFAKLDETKTSMVTSGDREVKLYKYISEDDHPIIKSYALEDNILKATFSVNLGHDYEGEKTPVGLSTEVVKNEDETYSLSPIGVSITCVKTWLKGKVFGKTFVDFGQSSTAIIKGLGSLFVSKEAREGTGGIIAIGFETTRILKDFGFNSFLRVWGLVSVNLAVINLLPFPGLDGWQLLVLAIEGISKKKVPNKVKTIVSLVGIALLFGLMILLVVKDVIKYII